VGFGVIGNVVGNKGRNERTNDRILPDDAPLAFMATSSKPFQCFVPLKIIVGSSSTEYRQIYCLAVEAAAVTSRRGLLPSSPTQSPQSLDHGHAVALGSAQSTHTGPDWAFNVRAPYYGMSTQIERITS
jgi:hypothetical protein